MNTVTIEVQYVNQPQPGKKKGSIKDKNNVMYGAFPDKLALFRPGGTYEISYTESPFRGVMYKNVESVREVAAPAPGAGGGARSGANDEHIFVSMIVKEAIRANLLDPNNADEVVRLGRLMRDAHKAIWSAQQQRQQPPDEMNDSIPF